jgi:hypothetical protein
MDTDELRTEGRLLIAYQESFMAMHNSDFWVWKEEPDNSDPTFGPFKLETGGRPGESGFPEEHPFEDWFEDEVIRVLWGG